MNIIDRFFWVAVQLAACVTAYSQTRVEYTVNNAWEFRKGNISTDSTVKPEIVNIPHTWNAEDGDDEEPGMYRGKATYTKSIFISESMSGKYAEMYFEGANQVAKLYINGEFVGEHKGGYTRFCFDITPYLKYGENNIFYVEVDNSHNPDIPPLSADFTFYGGIYRDVYLRFLNPVHIATNDYASSGVYLTTPQVSLESAVVEAVILLTNDSEVQASVIVENEIFDAEGNLVEKSSSSAKINAGETKRLLSEKFMIDAPRLWDIDDPYMYRFRTRVYDQKSGELLDDMSEPLGLRWFSFDPDKGFFLNGRHRKLVGTARHQDFFRKGNALRDEFHVQDVMLLKEVGGNFLRVSHYPQDPVVMEMCDKLGIVTSVEIPVINAVTESETFIGNAVEMAVEMVRQDFNRPSIMIWGYMNEILLRQPYENGPELDRYYDFTRKTAEALENRIREEDPSRYTMAAFHNAPSRYEKAGLTELPMILGWNLYQGWYEPDINEFQRLLDRARDVYKGKSLIVSEYGPGVDPRLHSYSPERFDFSQEYGVIFHRHYFKEISARPFIAGSSLWNLNDFYSESRVDAVPHVNNKGIVGLDREKKDSYRYYSAVLSSKPYISIGNKEWKSRGGTENSPSGKCVQPVPVFTNACSVMMTVNGEYLGERPVENGMASFDVPFSDGSNVIEVKAYKEGMEIRDRHVFEFSLVPLELKDFTQINVMLGSPRYFDDREAGLAWIPEKEYTPGSWGYIGGKPYRRETDFGTLLGSEIDIYGTDENPIYQTQRVGIEEFRADVPDGEYSVYLYWAELDGEMNRQALAYNLGADVKSSEKVDRVFDVSVNGRLILEDFNIAEEIGPSRAVIRKVNVVAREGKGISVKFSAKKAEPVLNAVRIYRNY